MTAAQSDGKHPRLASTPAVAAQLDKARERAEPNLPWQYIVGSAFFLLAYLAFGLTAVVVHLLTSGELGAHVELWPSLAVAYVVFAVAAVLLNGVMVRWLAERRVLEFSLSGWLREFGAGLAIGVAVIAASVGVVALLGGYQVSGVRFSTGILVAIAVGLGAGFSEEIFFRGVLLRLLDKSVGSWPAVAIVSVVFALAHAGNRGADPFDILALILSAGPLLCGAYLLTRRLWLAVGIHIGWNAALSGIFSITVSGTRIGPDGLLVSTMRGPDWLTGGAMGLEGSVVTTAIALAAGVAMLLAARRRGNLRPRVGKDAPTIDLRRASQ